jgi:hypothetical protein
MSDRGDRDIVRLSGTVLIVVGVSMWVAYAVGRYLLDWDITDRDVLPFHLITILPGMVLRYHRFFFFDLPARFSRGKEEKSAHMPEDRTSGSQSAFLKTLIVMNNFVHDLFTGLWVSTLLVIYLLHRKMRSLGGALDHAVLLDMMRTFFWIGIASVVLILLTGSFRLLYFRTENIGGDREIKKNLLIIKHVLFTFIFITGTYIAYLYAFS